jgi:hydroxymethylpyrimidine/phosphomethylpyrimidine kinase
MEAMAAGLRRLGAGAVLLKGGHLEGGGSPDLLLDDAGAVIFEAVRIETKNTHGTGCTLSSAIAALLARGAELREAVREAKDYTGAAIRAGAELEIGSGHGPVHHFHAFWKEADR